MNKQQFIRAILRAGDDPIKQTRGGMKMWRQHVRSYKDHTGDEMYLAMLPEMVESQVRAHSGTEIGTCFVARLRLLLDRWDQHGLPEDRIPPSDDDYTGSLCV